MKGQGLRDKLRSKKEGMSQQSNGDGELMRGLGSSGVTQGAVVHWGGAVLVDVMSQGSVFPRCASSERDTEKKKQRRRERI